MRGKPFAKGDDARRHRFDTAEAKRAAAARWARRVMDEMGLEKMPLPQVMLRPVAERDEQLSFWP